MLFKFLSFHQRKIRINVQSIACFFLQKLKKFRFTPERHQAFGDIAKFCNSIEIKLTKSLL